MRIIGLGKANRVALFEDCRSRKAESRCRVDRLVGEGDRIWVNGKIFTSTSENGDASRFHHLARTS